MLTNNFDPTDLTVPDVYSRARLAPKGPKLPYVSDDHNPFSRYLRILNRRKWLTLSLIGIVTGGTYLTCRSLAPIYESTATIDIDLQAPHGILGQDAQHATMMNDADQLIATQ